MTETTPRESAHEVAADSARRSNPEAVAQGEPIADTPMVVTLHELRPYDRNPRLVRNPRYDDIKASIRERGLDAPLAITRRPGESHFLVRSGGNTRLSILQELWTQTRDERFFRIVCVYRPWPARGDIVALTGHLAENELHGGLSFIEKALGVEQARELYEQEAGKPLTQAELARRLTDDGYPITQQHISRMQEAVRYLLPAIPMVLYAGLGKPQIERLSALRKAAARTWEQHAQHKGLADFTDLFLEILTPFDEDPADFSVQRVHDEIVSRLSALLGEDHDAIALQLIGADTEQLLLSPDAAHRSARIRRRAQSARAPAPSSETRAPEDAGRRLRGESNERPEAGDLWYIEPALDAPDRLRATILQLAQDIARVAKVATQIESAKDGVGFICTPGAASSAKPAPSAPLLLSLLNALSAPYVQTTRTADIDGAHLASALGPLLLGTLPSRHAPHGSARLGDTNLAKLFRLIRLARRLLELESARSRS